MARFFKTRLKAVFWVHLRDVKKKPYHFQHDFPCSVSTPLLQAHPGDKARGRWVVASRGSYNQPGLLVGSHPGPSDVPEWHQRPAQSKDLRWIHKYKKFEKKTKILDKKKIRFSKSFKNHLCGQIESPRSTRTNWSPTTIWRILIV